ncbi:MAG: vitamin B12/bleomycin/antimicrobial peptide transport system ATP-binding/permease protein [Gammaproteobacteria bacterium]|jgi:putative ATP-binding cassette transporter|nr:vitamin B12/bleomycin/antimicrobial peptide transport system ATP-binding/permease protein [Gammaproteobacteria bacterium]
MNRESNSDEIANSGLLPQLGMMVRAFWGAPVRNTLFLLSGALFLVIAVTAYGQIRLNNWNQPFYDALSHRDFAHFLAQLGVFGLIAGSLLGLNVAQRWLGETLKLRLRQGLTLDLIRNWLQPGRAFRLANAGPMGVNPDQRMHEDARHLTELSADLGIGLLQSSILLVTFVSVLWSLSNNFVFHVGDRHFSIPGYMVWAAIVYSGSASLLSYWVGRSLIDRNAQRYAREADLRFSLVRVSEHIDAIALSAGEADEQRRIEIDLVAVLAATGRLVTGLTNLAWITGGYGWFTLVAPILAAAPLYFAGNISFGGLMMASGAFIQVQSSLRWFVDNFSTIADWRATLLRVASFRRAVIDTDVLHDVESRIAVVAGDPGKITIDDLEIASPAGATMLEEKKVEIKAGERVLIVGESGTGKTLLFRALAGLWPWGAGRVAHPRGEELLYMPRTPYFPPGTLREALAYPSASGAFEAPAYTKALVRLELERLVPLLDVSRRWDHELNEDEQQTLAFARVVLHAPPWILIDEVLDSLDENARRCILDLFAKDLQHTGIIHIGRADAHDHVFSRVLHLVKDPALRRLPASVPLRRESAAAAPVIS